MRAPRKSNRARRGAVMVEGVIAFTLMVMFAALSLWIYRGYLYKLREEAKTRTDALTEASHSCSGGSSTGTGASIGGQAAGIAGRLNGGGMGDSMSMKSVTKTGSATFEQRVAVNRQSQLLSGKVDAWSQVTCRPEPQSSGSPFGGGLGSLRGSVGL